jgi:HEAT repeat protein
MLASRNKRFLFAPAIFLILGGAGAFWLEREPLLTWYYLRGLAHADESERGVWLERVATLGGAALPGLLDQLGGEDVPARANATAALDRISGEWERDDARWSDLTERLASKFGGLGKAGQCAVLELTATWVRPGCSPTAGKVLLQYAANLVDRASRQCDEDVRGSALDVAGALLAHGNLPEALGPCRELARACLRDRLAKNRERAVQLALFQPINLSEEVVPLLQDPAPEVRRAVVLAIGGSRQLISDEGLALALHDDDAQVRRLCERALRGRGLTERHLILARDITDRRPAVRLRVLYRLHEESGLDIGLWLRLLSQDPADEVRLAAIRAAVEQGVVEMKDRMEQMCLNDPSPTVRQWSRNYLDIQKREPSLSGP